jgi:hypothetical protein
MDEGFAPGIGEKLRSYVYLLVDPRTGRTFFAGRGRNDRCFRHVQAARVDEAGEPGSVGRGGRTFPVLERIREIQSSGRSVRIDILRYGLDADEARLVEAVACDALGLRPPSDDRGAGTGRDNGAGRTMGAKQGKRAGEPSGARPSVPAQRTEATRLNTLLARPAKIKRSHRVVLLRLGKALGPGTSDAQVEEAVRSAWKIGRRWTDPESRRSPQWAFAVVDDVVRAVFRIDGWKPSDSTTGTADPTPPARGGQAPWTRPSQLASSQSPATGPPARWTLTGERDPELEQRYRGRNVSAYLSSGSQNPVTYVWCGPHWVNSPA